MQLRLVTKLTLVMTSLVFLVVAVLSVVFLGQLLQQVLQETDKNAKDLAHYVFLQVQNALTDAANEGIRPSSTSPDTFAMNLALATADRAVKSIYPFFKELSEDEWWTDLLAAWIKFEAKGPPKSVGFLYILFTFVFNL